MPSPFNLYQHGFHRLWSESYDLAFGTTVKGCVMRAGDDLTSQGSCGFHRVEGRQNLHCPQQS
jgi:hypothetical protein